MRALIDAFQEFARDDAHIHRAGDWLYRNCKFFPVAAEVYQAVQETTESAPGWQSPAREPRKTLKQTLRAHGDHMLTPEARTLARRMRTTPEAGFGSIDDEAADWIMRWERAQDVRTVASLAADQGKGVLRPAAELAELCARLGVEPDTELARRRENCACGGLRTRSLWFTEDGRELCWECGRCRAGDWIEADTDAVADIEMAAATYETQIQAALKRFNGDAGRRASTRPVEVVGDRDLNNWRARPQLTIDWQAAETRTAGALHLPPGSNSALLEQMVLEWAHKHPGAGRPGPAEQVELLREIAARQGTSVPAARPAQRQEAAAAKAAAAG
ncbi:MAG: hypothetical protein WD733_06510 [Bryobacterales bacterium]